MNLEAGGDKESRLQAWAGSLAGRFYMDRRLIVLTMLLAVAAGASSLAILPRMEDPLLTQRAANVTTLFPGADAERVEALVTEKIEDRLLDVPEIKRMRSQSRAGSSFINIELRDDVYDTDPIWSQIRGKIEDSISDLPPGAQRPEFNELEIAAYAWIGAIVWEGTGDAPSSLLRRLARDLKDRLFAIPGTKAVDLFGDPHEEILVEIDPDQSLAAGLPPGAIAQQLARGDVKASAGMLRGGDSEIVLELQNQFESLEDIRTATLVTDQPGETLSLSDVASVRRTTPEPAAARAVVDGRPGVVVAVMLRPAYRIDHWAEEARAVVADYQQHLSAGLALDVIMEQEPYVTQRLDALTKNLMLGVCAVAAVTFLFMGWRSALLVTATLPIASLMVLAGMRALAIPIHQMSITGLIIALGLMIDNAIIATDEIQLSLRRGLGPKQAVTDMVSRLFAPLLASTVTTALAFAPIALMEGPAGEFVGAIAQTVMLAIFSSFCLAMTVLPATAALLQRRLFLPDDSESRSAESSSLGKLQWFWRHLLHHGISLPALTRAYRRGLEGMLRRPLLGVLGGMLLPVAGFVAATQLSEQFFPPADRDQFYVELELAPQASMAQTEVLAAEVEQQLRNEDRVRHVSWFLGESAPPFYYNIIARRANNPNYAQAIVTLDSNRNALDLIRRLQLQLDDAFPTARILVRQLEQGPPFDAPVEVRLLGADLSQLRAWGEEVRAMTTSLPNVLHTRTMLSETRPVAAIKVDARESSWVGLSEAEIASQLFARFEGLFAGTIIEEVEEIPVRVRIAAQRRRSVDDITNAGLLASRDLVGANGAQGAIPTQTVASIKLMPQRAVITRFNGRRCNEVQCFITAGTLPSVVLDDLRQQLQSAGVEQRLPGGFDLEFGGEASERDAAVSRLMANVSVLAVGMVGALVLALASFRLTALIGLVAVLSIGLGMGALWIFGYPFGFMAIVGTMGLIGIAINDSIVVVAALGHHPQVVQGDIDATVDTVVDVTRHVLATTGTTVFGFMPLLLSGGGFWPPLAVAIGTGVAGATLISITLVPSAFRLMSSWQARPADP